MFNINSFPAAVRIAFNGVPILWPNTVQAAVDAGIGDLDKLADLIFFQHHKERMSGGIGKPLTKGEPDFKALVAEWKGFRKLAAAFTPGATGGGGGSTWTVPEAAQRDIRKMAGQAAVDWILKAPTAKAEAREFKPTKKNRDDFAAVIIWKSADPASVCTMDKRMIQATMLLRDDIAYWRGRSSSETEAQMGQAAAQANLIDYRKFTVTEKRCIASARAKIRHFDKELTLTGIVGMLMMMPVPSNIGGGAFKNVGELISAVVAKVTG